MNKVMLVKTVATKLDVKGSVVEQVVDSVIDTIKEELAQGSEVNIPDFGKFAITVRAARMGRNPQTGDPVEIDETAIVKFKPAKKFKTLVN